jgi:hypothetical protein
MHCQGGAGKALTRAMVSCQRLCGHAKLRPPCEDVIYTPAPVLSLQGAFLFE